LQHLADPRAHGGDPADAFHLVIPSIPGYGFSGPTHEAGWTTDRVAKAWAQLMARLGYTRYGTQGGDWGAFISPKLGRIDPDHVVGVYVHAATMGFIPFGPVDPDELASFTDAEKERLNRFLSDMNGYFQVQATRPQTLPTRSPIPQSGSWPGSWRSSRSGPTPPRSCPRMPWTATTCSST
jgi:pimeloyl-ACP methyl ester carboxylesterase